MISSDQCRYICVLIFQQLSFRAAKETLAKIRHSVGTMLNLSGMVNSNGMNDLNKSTSADKTEKELYVFLQNLGDKFDMMPMVQVSPFRKMFLCKDETYKMFYWYRIIPKKEGFLGYTI